MEPFEEMTDLGQLAQNPEPDKYTPTVKELDDLVVSIFDQKAVCESKDRELAEENKKLAALEMKAVAWLDELKREKYQHPRGTIYVKEDWRFNLPVGDENKSAFFSWLREKGLYDKYATINATSYNALLNAEWALAQEEGRAMEFAVPGVPEPKFVRRLGRNKGRG